METWKDIDGYDGRYKISNKGNVKSFCHGEKIMHPKTTRNGYLCVYLSDGNKSKYNSVHRLVASAFIPNTENKTQVNHIDGDKNNNDVSNLEWVTPSENVIHAHKVLGKNSPMLNKKGKENKNSIPVCQYDLNGNFVKQWDAVSDAARAIGCKPCQIINVIAGRILTCHGFIWSYEKADVIDNSRVVNKKTHKVF